MKPVDSHCHMDFEQFDGDREEVLERCREKLEFVVNAGSNIEHNRKALRLEEKHEVVTANLGLHPTYTDCFDQIDEIKEQIREHFPAAIGEIGLDHHHVKGSGKRKEQEEVFRSMLELAEEIDSPVVVHSRDVEKKAVDILQEYDLQDVMLHCFNGKPRLAERAIEDEMKIGITTQVLYSDRVQRIAERINISDIMLETDSPFLYRGERNEPVNVLESAERIAQIKEMNQQKVVEMTARTAEEFFS